MPRKKGYLTSRKSKGKALRSLAKTTKGGKGKIKNRARSKSFHKR